MVRSPSSLKVTSVIKKGPWTSEEDEILTNHIKLHGHPNWRALPRLSGLARCGKSCRLRWTNYLQPGIKRGNFRREEEEAIITLHQLLGNRWSAIAAKLPGRTDNEIKNVWHTHLKKRLLNKDDVQQSSPSTHQSSISNTSDHENDFILVDESIFDTVWDDHSINQVHYHATNVEDTNCDQSDTNPNDTLACNTYSNNHIIADVPSSSLPLQRSYSDTSYNNYEDVLSPEAFLETDESFWSDVLSSDHDHNNNNSCTSSMESYYPCYNQQLVDESIVPSIPYNNLINMETAGHLQEVHVTSSLSNVGSNQVSNVTSEYITIENGGDVDDFWFDVLFRAGEHPVFLG